jgi:cytochrome P450
MFEYGAHLIEEKRSHPADDMLSVVVHAELPDEDPSTLTDIELYMFFSLLFAAGSETTRNSIAGGLLALLERPDQLAALQADLGLLPGAIEEMLRWTTPSPSKRRTATRSVELAGHAIAPGDKVLYWEASANRDELVFERSMEFDIRRDPNPHLAFGHGLHHCLGASLARLESQVVFTELLSEFVSFDLAGDVEWTRSNRHTGIRRMPLRATRG